jgi:hypothetical protein
VKGKNHLWRNTKVLIRNSTLINRSYWLSIWLFVDITWKDSCRWHLQLDYQ